MEETSTRVSAKKLPDIWYCEMTTWGRRKVTCDTPVQSDKKKSSNVENNAKKNKEEEEKKKDCESRMGTM